MPMEQMFTFLGLVVVAVAASGYLNLVKAVSAAMYEVDNSQVKRKATSIRLTDSQKTTTKKNHWLNAAVF
jgi:hypothetical protein